MTFPPAKNTIQIFHGCPFFFFFTSSFEVFSHLGSTFSFIYEAVTTIILILLIFYFFYPNRCMGKRSEFSAASMTCGNIVHFFLGLLTLTCPNILYYLLSESTQSRCTLVVACSVGLVSKRPVCQLCVVLGALFSR